MVIYKYLPKANYTKFDNRVMVIDRKVLSDGAKILYIYLAHFQTGRKITHSYLLKVLGISRETLKKYIRQLKDVDLIRMEQVGARDYECYIGSTEIRASRVKDLWSVLDEEDASSPYTAEDIKAMQEE